MMTDYRSWKDEESLEFNLYYLKNYIEALLKNAVQNEKEITELNNRLDDIIENISVENL